MPLNKHDMLLKAAAEAVLENENMRDSVSDALGDVLSCLEMADEDRADAKSSIKIAIAKLNALDAKLHE